MLEHNDNVYVEDEVLVEAVGKRSKLWMIIAGVAAVLVVGLAGIFVAVNNDNYESISAIKEENPDGVSDGAVFVVRDKVYKYNSSNDAFDEMAELTDVERQVIANLDTSLDLSALNTLRENISVTTDFSSRKIYERQYTDLLVDLMRMNSDNLDTVQHIYNNYLYSADFEGVLQSKIAALQNNMAELNIYATYMLDFISQDDELFRASYNNELSALQLQIQNEKEKLEALRGNSELSLESLVEVEELINAYDKALKGDLEVLLDDKVRDSLREEYNRLDNKYSAYLGTVDDMQSLLNTGYLSDEALQGYLSKYDNYLSDYETELNTLNQKMLSCVDNNEFARLVEEQNKLSSSLSSAITTLNSLSETNTNSYIQEQINETLESVSDVWSKEVLELASTVNTLSNQMAVVESEISKYSNSDILNYVNEVDKLNQSLLTVREEIRVAEQNSDTELVKSLEKQKVELEKELTKTTEAFASKITELETTDSEINNRVDEIEQVMTSLVTSEQIDTTRKDIESTISELDKQLATTINSLDSKMAQSLWSTSTELQSVIDTLRNNNELSLAEIRGMIENLSTDSGSDYSKLLEIIDELSKTSEEDDTKLKTLITNLETELKDTNDKLKDELSESGEKVAAKLLEVKEGLEADISSLDKVMNEKLTAEEEARKQAVETINNNLSTEKEKREEAISAVNTALSEEVNNRLTSMTTLSTDLRGIVNDEVVERKDAVATLGNNLTTEINDRINAVTGVQNGLTLEITNRETAISNVEDSISKETKNREEAITNLESIVTNNNNTLNGSIAALKTDLNAEDTAIKGDVADIKSDINTIKSDVSTSNNDIANLKTNLGNATGDIATLKTSLTNTGNELQDIKSDITDVNSNVSTLNTALANETATRVQELTNTKTELTSLVNNLKTLQGTTISNNSDAIVILEQEVAALDTRITALATSQAEALTKAKTELEGKISSVNVSLTKAIADGDTALQTSLNARIDELTTELADVKSSLELQLSNLSNTVGNNTTKLNTLSTNYTTLNTKVDDLSTKLTSEIAAVTTSINTLKANLETDINALDTKVSELDTKLTGLTATISAVESIANVNKANITTMQADIGVLTTDVNNLEGDLTTLEGDVTSLDGTVNTNKNNIASLTTQLGDANTSLTGVKSDVATLNSNYNTLQTNIADNYATNAYVDNAVSSMTTVTDELKTKMEAIENQAVYELPTATANELGGVKVDGTTITINADGVISAVGGTSSGDIGWSDSDQLKVGSTWENYLDIPENIRPYCIQAIHVGTACTPALTYGTQDTLYYYYTKYGSVGSITTATSGSYMSNTTYYTWYTHANLIGDIAYISKTPPKAGTYTDIASFTATEYFYEYTLPEASNATRVVYYVDYNGNTWDYTLSGAEYKEEVYGYSNDQGATISYGYRGVGPTGNTITRTYTTPASSGDYDTYGPDSGFVLELDAVCYLGGCKLNRTQRTKLFEAGVYAPFNSDLDPTDYGTSKYRYNAINGIADLDGENIIPVSLKEVGINGSSSSYPLYVNHISNFTEGGIAYKIAHCYGNNVWMYAGLPA